MNGLNASSLLTRVFFLFSLLNIIVFSPVLADDKDQFPDLSGRFSSNTESCLIENRSVNYGKALTVIFESGELHRRRNKDVHYDYFFEGSARLVVYDTLALDNLWSRVFKDSTKLAFRSAYICGENITELLGIDPSVWTNDKIPRPSHKKLHFRTNSADKYFGISLPGELANWSAMDMNVPPIWMDIEIDNTNQLVLYVTPEIDEQLNVYVYDELTSEPFLAAAFQLYNQIVSKPITIDTTEISILLKESGKFDASCRLRFAKDSDARGLKLILPFLYDVDSVLDGQGNRLPFIKKHLRNRMYVGNREIIPGQSDEITIYYRGKFIAARYAGYDYPSNLTGWFPRFEHRNLGHFTINYTYYKDLTLLSVGQLINETDSGDFRRSTFTTDAEISYISFALGKYKIFSERVGEVPINLYIETQNTIGLFNRDVPEKILSIITESFRTFADWFGPPIVDKLNVVDRAKYAGQSSPGLIHLPNSNIFSDEGRVHLCSHEVAHQWFGHTAVPKTYREMWLSEGLAEYVSYLYIKDIDKDEKECKKMVDTWRKHVVQTGMIGDMYSRGYKAGPISLGGRLYQSYSPGDYIALVYAKAAYMLNMLRFEIDGPDYRTDFFIRMLGEYCRENFGQGTSSTDFMKMTARRIGQERAIQFFNQWLFDWRIPDYSCSYDIRYDEQGRNSLEFSIVATKIDELFATPFPIRIVFDDGSVQNFRVDNVGQQESFVLGPFPEKIKNVLFDPDDILLYGEKKVVEL
ncbi:MAG: M1 family aminopeptidase [Candidatus Zixiibacteriota bacterium]